MTERIEKSEEDQEEGVDLRRPDWWVQADAFVAKGRSQEREYLLRKIREFGGVYPEWLENFKEFIKDDR